MQIALQRQHLFAEDAMIIVAFVFVVQVRKLEFLVADALQQKADTLVTIGGIQSNHCRATAVAARYHPDY